ncbi:CPBP family intramembrane glutamic endopeptidase [Ammoniphilus sp. YIM 78166]|uniref:CPBP family intramembrane glutamic endopeptidase n=1 Tax=Ammoniphilus sp. YIM 78166 TaxID=1644106 RepID=UPI00106FDBC9|nr:type II CAAX endopeptidase family protein [Ammoniphilus sp. YIM 78166]
MDPRIQQMDDRLLLLNLYLTQAIALVLGFLGLYFFYLRQGVSFTSLFSLGENGYSTLGWALLLAALIIVIEVCLVYSLPATYFDDGGINKKLFSNRTVGHIIVMTAIVAFCEELLFRLVLQDQIGLFWTSVIFAFVHIRYISKWVMFTTVFLVSLSFGWLYIYTGSVIAPMVSHFVVDLILALFIRFDLLKDKK